MYFFIQCALLYYIFHAFSIIYFLGISCGSPPALLHGRMKRWGGNFLFESIIEYECDRGYDIIGTPRRQCLGNKTWSGNVPRCEGIVAINGIDGIVPRDFLVSLVVHQIVF